MTRAEVAAVLAVELQTQLADAGMAAADVSGGLREPLDRALRALGYGAAETPPAEQDEAFLAAATVETLRAVLKRIGDRFDLTTAEGSFRLRQTVENVEKLLAEAKADLADALAGGGPVARNLGFLEPAGVGW